METNLLHFPVSNLGVLFREEQETLDFWLDNVALMDANSTFNRNILYGNADYLLITLTNEMDGVYRYTNRESGSHFYTFRLDEKTASASVLKDYEESPISIDNILDELRYLCSHISPNIIILLQTVSDVVFPLNGKDKNYANRIALNQVAEKLSDEFPNVKLIDIRKYAKFPGDFWEAVANHYNRAIGYSLAQDVLRAMGVEGQDDAPKARNADCPPSNAIRKTAKVKKETVSYLYYLQNGRLHLRLDTENDALRFYGKVFQSRSVVAELTLENGAESVINVDKPGVWWIMTDVFQGDSKLGSFRTEYINYSPLNFFKYADANAGYYDVYKNSLDQFMAYNALQKTQIDSTITNVSKLAAVGCNIADYFLSRNINEISVFFQDPEVCKCVMPFLKQSGLNIRYIFTTSFVYTLGFDGDMATQPVNHLDALPYGTKEHILFQGSMMSMAHAKIAKSGVQIHYLNNVISSLLTTKFFMNRLSYFMGERLPLMIAVRIPSITKLFGFPKTGYKPNERMISTQVKNANYAWTNLSAAYDKFPPQLRNIPKEQLRETLQRPLYYVPSGAQANRMKDRSGKYANIRDGFRVTCGQPENFVGNIWLFGGGKVFGYGSSDEETIASCLQSVINLPFKVHNRSNYTNVDSMFMALRLMKETEFQRNDVVVLFVDNYVTSWEWPIYWMNWDAITEPVVKVDAYPLFLKAERPDYFLLPEGYTPAANRAIAELIRDAIYQNIRLF